MFFVKHYDIMIARVCGGEHWSVPVVICVLLVR